MLELRHPSEQQQQPHPAVSGSKKPQQSECVMLLLAGRGPATAAKASIYIKCHGGSFDAGLIRQVGRE